MKELRRRQKEIELIVGIDIGQESSQICYYDEQQRQPVSVSVVNSVDNRQKYQFGFMLSGANQDNLKELLCTLLALLPTIVWLPSTLIDLKSFARSVFPSYP